MAPESLDIPYRGGFVGRDHHFALTVYFEDTDAYGIVYYANYLKFMERARSDFIRAVGVDQAAELRASGSAYAVVEVDIKYRRPARLGDDLLVVSSVRQVRASSVDIHQRVMRSSELLTDARVTAAFLDGSGRPRRQPSDWVEKFNAITTRDR
jgi:acyl-CoA thioester hydrolase